MLFQYNAFFLVLGLTALVSAVVAIAAWRRRSASPASIAFVHLMLAITGFATISSLEAAVVRLSDKIFWSTLEYAGSGSVVTLFLIFALHFTRRTQWLNRRTVLLLFLIPGFNLLLAATNHYHHLIWTDFLPGPPNSNQVIYQHGLGFYWVMLCSYVYTLVSSSVLIQSARTSSLLQQQQSVMALVGAIIPLLGGCAYMLNLSPPGLNIIPMSFLLTGLIYFITLFRFRLFDLVPVARDTLIESMTDGLLVFDLQNRLVDFNPAARYLLNQSLQLGQPLQQVFANHPDVVQLCQTTTTAEVQIRLEGLAQRSEEIAPRYLMLHTIPLSEKRRVVTGHLLVLRDVTQQHQAERDLRRLNHQLQTQLHEIQGLQTQLREQAMRDELTGLFNRRYFEATLARELARAMRDGYPVAIILMDVDFFKRINDTYGHQGGDRFLQEFGHLLRMHSRQGDVACRYGGEEFVLTLPGMTMQDAYHRADQIRSALAALQVEFRDTTIQTTLSLGISLFPFNGMSTEALLSAADQALYQAKAEGRNCIRWPAPVPNQAMLPPRRSRL